MKKLFALLVVTLFATVTFGQKIEESKVPEAVKLNLKAKVATVKDVAWEQQDTNYTAEFLMDEAKTEMTFDKKGTWQNTEWEIPAEYTPHGIKKYLDSAYAGNKIKEFALVEFPTDGKVYVLEVVKKKECQKVYFSLKGEFKKAEKMVCEGKCSDKKKCCKKKKCDKDKAAAKPDTTTK